MTEEPLRTELIPDQPAEAFRALHDEMSSLLEVFGGGVTSSLCHKEESSDPENINSSEEEPEQEPEPETSRRRHHRRLTMGSLCWMLLFFSLSAAPSSALEVADVQLMADIIRTNYFVTGSQFSVAMNVPVNPALRPAAVAADPSATVIQEVTHGDLMYVGTNVVEAAPLKITDPVTKRSRTEHAEARVLDNIADLVNRRTDNIMMFYTYLSPCGSKCLDPTRDERITEKLRTLFNRYEFKAFAFTTVFDRQGVLTTKEIEDTLYALGAAVGYGNVFRCSLPRNRAARCLACFQTVGAALPQLSNRCTSNTRSQIQAIDEEPELEISKQRHRQRLTLGSLRRMLRLFSLRAGLSSAVELNDLQTIVQSIRTNYSIENSQFCVAMNVPTNPNLRPAAFDADPSATVISRVSSGQVYKGSNVIEATPQERVNQTTQQPYTEHAEARVLEWTNILASRPDNNIIMFYTYFSPCGDKCMDPEHNERIIEKLTALFGYNYPNKAFVFTQVFDPQQVEQSLTTLGTAVGHRNVFRCFFPLESNAECLACFTPNAAGQQQLNNRCTTE